MNGKRYGAVTVHELREEQRVCPFCCRPTLQLLEAACFLQIDLFCILQSCYGAVTKTSQLPVSHYSTILLRNALCKKARAQT
jgi:hypothetical protein